MQIFYEANKFICSKKCTVPKFGSFVSVIPSVSTQSVDKNITYRCDDGYHNAGTTTSELISHCLENET